MYLQGPLVLDQQNLVHVSCVRMSLLVCWYQLLFLKRERDCYLDRDGEFIYLLTKLSID